MFNDAFSDAFRVHGYSTHYQSPLMDNPPIYSPSSSHPSISAFSYAAITLGSHKLVSFPGTPCFIPSNTPPMQSSHRFRLSINMRALSPISLARLIPATAPAVPPALTTCPPGLGLPAPGP